MYMHAAFHKAL